MPPVTSRRFKRFGSGFGRAQQAFGGAADIGGASEIWLGVGRAHLEQKNAGRAGIVAKKSASKSGRIARAIEIQHVYEDTLAEIVARNLVRKGRKTQSRFFRD